MLEVHGRIKCAIAKKEFAADQLEVIIQGALKKSIDLRMKLKDSKERRKLFGLMS